MRVAVFLTAIASVTAFNVTVTNHWNGGFQGKFSINADHAIYGWRAHIVCNNPLDKLEVLKADLTETRNGNKEFVLESKPFDANIADGGSQEVDFICHFTESIVPNCAVTVNSGRSHSQYPGQQTALPFPSEQRRTQGNGTRLSRAVSAMKYDYAKALSLSILFYDAQRSGKLPPHNHIPWRGDSALHDGDNGHDLSGGWYDAGDHVKFNFPMAMSTHTLLLGFIKFQDVYKHFHQKDMMCDMIKWPLDYFLKCWIPSQQTYYFQVGDPNKDHSFWGRPENMHMDRPAFKITPAHPGSDVAGDTASAFAAGHIAFKTICGNAAYADTLLQAAKSIYDFAKNHQGIYSKSFPQGGYGSNGFKDELSVAAAWLYQATHDAKYLNDAKQFHETGYLLYEITKNVTYKNEIIHYVKDNKPGGTATYTPCGLLWKDQWGSNRYAANGAFIALLAAVDGIETHDYVTWAMSQINYLLGDNNYGISYEIGFGSKYPQHPHHRGSACRTTTTQCSFADPGPNPNVLNGALVGGPDAHDHYEDRRDDYVKNEVACDYNAGFQGALAGKIKK
ncbi:hypothetical protein CHS0354_016185 [Potamilus streckersoni]|uniref:Endoglucanase n=1 Tax=Potamilus streckersoni TaxID=2493646 RepID=A0AAE0VKV5_9BIVA|nr:hypothetical protein CHS0354_016185 [Potamilus streckersoni]